MTITIPTSGEMIDEAAEKYEAGRIAAIKYYVETGIKDLETNLGLGEDRGKIFPHPDYITLDKVWKDIRDVLKEGGYEVEHHNGSWGFWLSVRIAPEKPWWKLWTRQQR